ncbi:MAG: AAA family ATPase, partial [Deltaproteobacteria bacterium]|nr:AAA family ATPase [Deltaproteobacteria bacterium]
MYKIFFGFKERPFQLVPNPAYLFLSKSYEEAVVHLSYAISHGDGFVEITGEVGTGKTTLCRAFLENLDKDTEAAYIFNPKLDSMQLLKTINDEFGIKSDADNTKDLIDTLNSFLMEKKAEGKKVILIIDEAQNLNKEVLEQLRLLSNLETTTSKLLQIILVGQPELGEMLDSPELRQLGQRITLSCYLKPLTFKETREYIRHRIRIASQKPGIKFTRGAFRSIYKYSGGIPRSINIACDRILLTAFGLSRRKITGSIVRPSIRELAGRGDIKRYGLQKGKNTTLFLTILCLVLLMVILSRPGELDIIPKFKIAGYTKPEISSPRQPVMETPMNPVPHQTPIVEQEESIPEQRPIEDQEKELSEQESVPKPVQNLGGVLMGMNTLSSRHMALKAAMDLWNNGSDINQYLDNMEDDRIFFRLAAKQNGLLIHRIEGDLDLIKRLNLPAILEFYLPERLSPRYLTISKMDEGKITLRGLGEDDAIMVETEELKSFWSGVAYIPWKNFLNYIGTIPRNAPRDSIITLKMLMKGIGFNDIEVSPLYDERTREA